MLALDLVGVLEGLKKAMPEESARGILEQASGPSSEQRRKQWVVNKDQSRESLGGNRGKERGR